MYCCPDLIDRILLISAHSKFVKLLFGCLYADPTIRAGVRSCGGSIRNLMAGPLLSIVKCMDVYIKKIHVGLHTSQKRYR